MVVFSSLVGCQTTPDASSRLHPASSAANTFQSLLSSEGSTTFRSWNGEALGLDSDTELTFYQSHVAHMFEWGLSVNSYWGHYTASPSGRIRLSLDSFGKDWPDMQLYKEGGDLLLTPSTASTQFYMGNRQGAVLPHRNATFWPFRRLSGSDERDVLDMIEAFDKKNKQGE